MMRKLSLIIWLLLLLNLSACGVTEKPAPELLEPVGVQLDSEVVKPGVIYNLAVYDAQILPYVEELYFKTDGTLESVDVTLGETVTKGQTLATLGVESLKEQIDTLQSQINYEERIGSYADKIAQKKIDIEKMTLKKMKANGASQQDCRLKELDIEKLELELEQQQELRWIDLKDDREKVEQLSEKLALGTRTAPFDGRVVYIGSVNPGSTVRGYTTVICLADESRLTLQTEYVSPSEIENADDVFVKVKDKEYDVEYLPIDQLEYISKVIAGEKVNATFTVKADDGALESGMYAVLMVYKTYKENVLTVPVNALYYDGSIRYVYKLVGEQRIRCNVKIGTSTDTKVEILDGLAEGDVVYVRN